LDYNYYYLIDYNHSIADIAAVDVVVDVAAVGYLGVVDVKHSEPVI